MFLAKNSGQIVLGRDTEEQLLKDLGRLQITEIVETDEKYVLYNSQYLTEDEVLTNLKIAKQTENTEKAKQAVENGYVTFKDAQFETNTQTVGDLTATMLLMQASGLEIYTWLSKDDKAVELTLEDFGTLGGLIAEYKNTVWNNKYISFKTAIEQAATSEEVKRIDLNYNFDTDKEVGNET